MKNNKFSPKKDEHPQAFTYQVKNAAQPKITAWISGFSEQMVHSCSLYQLAKFHIIQNIEINV